ncbi:MAG: hypothetical protein JXR42_02995 [Gammaproteobacteria bacterium]|nr:hypothetical protein [Gammaproteobacteria bacterium]
MNIASELLVSRVVDYDDNIATLVEALNSQSATVDEKMSAHNSFFELFESNEALDYLPLSIASNLSMIMQNTDYKFSGGLLEFYNLKLVIKKFTNNEDAIDKIFSNLLYCGNPINEKVLLDIICILMQESFVSERNIEPINLVVQSIIKNTKWGIISDSVLQSMFALLKVLIMHQQCREDGACLVRAVLPKLADEKSRFLESDNVRMILTELCRLGYLYEEIIALTALKILDFNIQDLREKHFSFLIF